MEIATGDPLTGDFNNPVVLRLGITGDDPVIALTLSTGDSLTTADQPITYVWHVRGVDGAGNTGDFSQVRRITIDVGVPRPDLVAELISPRNGATGDDVTLIFTWSPVTGDLSFVTYTPEIGFGTGDFTNLAFTADGLQDTQFTLSEANKLTTGDFVWHVVTLDGAGNTGDSGPFTFKILEDATPPGVPTLISPSDGSTEATSTPAFVWTQVIDDVNRVTDKSGVKSYPLEIDLATADFTDPVFSKGDIPDASVILRGQLVIRFHPPPGELPGNRRLHLACRGTGRSRYYG